MIRTLGLLLAACCAAVAHADGQPTAAPAAAMTDGWIVGASNQILRLDKDGAYQVVHQVPGLRHLRVLPGTQTVVVGGDAGVEVFKDGQWSSVYPGKWGHIEYSMNYRTLTVQGGNKLDITQLQPEIKNLEAYPDVGGDPARDLRGALSGEGGMPGGGMPVEAGGMTAGGGVGAGWLPSGRGELAFASQLVRLAPDKPAVKVWADSNGQKLPVQFIASDDAKEIEYGVAMAGERGWLLKLDVKTHANDPGAAAVPGEKAEPAIVVPLTQDLVLAQLIAPVERMIPAPAPYLAYISGGRLEAVNLEAKRPVVLRSTMADMAALKWPDDRMGDAWSMNAADPSELLAVCPAPWFNELALDGSCRCCVVKGNSPISPVSTDIMGLVGFGPFKWPAGKPSGPVQAPLAATADLEKRPMDAATDPRPEGAVFIEGRTFFVMADGKLQEQSKSLIKFGQECWHSADQKVLLINAGARTRDPATDVEAAGGPCYVLTPDACLLGPGAGQLAADGSRVWFRDKQSVQAFDTKTGKMTLLLTRPRRSRADFESPPPRPALGPEFEMNPESGASGKIVIADEDRQSWVAVLPNRKGETAHRYADESRSEEFLGIWRRPNSGTVVFERVAAKGGGGLLRIWNLSSDRSAQWTKGSYSPLLSEFLVAPRYPVDLQGDEHRVDLAPQAVFGPYIDPHRYFEGMRYLCWSKSGTNAVGQSTGREPFGKDAGCALISLGDTLSMSRVSPETGYFFLDFASDGESLLAVVDQRIAEPKAVAGRQVLAKISLKTGQVTWSSQPFANCQGMVPYPDFDLKAFHDAQAAGF